MNSKSEWGSISVPRVVVQQEGDKENNRGMGGNKILLGDRDMDTGDKKKRRRQNSIRN